MMLLGVMNIFGGQTGLHSIIALYLLIGGLFLSAIAVKRRKRGPYELSEGANGLVKAVEKLSEPKAFGFTCLAISPLPLGFGGFGLLVFLLLYLSAVNAMRLTDEELMGWIAGPNATVVFSPRPSGLGVSQKTQE